MGQTGARDAADATGWAGGAIGPADGAAGPVGGVDAGRVTDGVDAVGVAGVADMAGVVGAMGLRERKKLRMYQDVSDIAVSLFLEKGFERVSVAEVAAAAEISKPTLFRYFSSKEDLVLYRFADHETEAARVVGDRMSGQSAIEALRLHFLAGIERSDPVTGVNGDPHILAFHRLLYGTPSLVARLYEYLERSEAALATALGGNLEARLAAGQVVAVQRILAMDNWRRIARGEEVAKVRRDAAAAAEAAFVRLEQGLPNYTTR